MVTVNSEGEIYGRTIVCAHEMKVKTSGGSVVC